MSCLWSRSTALSSRESCCILVMPSSGTSYWQ
jgi:hypothetical protein